MVIRRRAFSALAALSIFLALPATPQARELSDYRIGDVAEETIVSPAALTLPQDNPAARDLDSTIVCFRFNTNAATESEAAFRAAVNAAHTNFLNSFESTFGRRKALPQDFASSRFQQLVFLSQVQNALFLANTNLAERWALGESEEPWIASLCARLHEAQERPVYNPDALPSELSQNSTVRLLLVARRSEKPAAGTELHPLVLTRADLRPLARARADLRASLPPSDAATADFLGSFLQANCIPDAELTRMLRDPRPDPGPDRLEPGQTIVRRGDIIDRRAKTAIDQILRLPAPAPAPAAVAAAAKNPAPVQRWPMISGRTILIICAAGWVVCLGLIALIWEFRRRRTSARGAVVYSESTVYVLGEDPVRWIQSARTPEERAQRAEEILRAGLLPRLAGVLSNGFVRRLVSQRAQLLQTQKAAASEMDQLADRLEIIHTRMQDRMLAYEQQIARLEKELESRNAESREMIKAELEQIRKRMDAERADDRMRFN
ncbi:MAG: hypothetical protein U1F98_15215 [Verrucomicrobiota bacterium]